jgi:hypothetical protein
MSNNEPLNTIDYLRIVMDYLAIDEKEFSQIRRRTKGSAVCIPALRANFY